MITFDIVRVNKSNYTNRYYANIALGYSKNRDANTSLSIL